MTRPSKDLPTACVFSTQLFKKGGSMAHWGGTSLTNLMKAI